MSNCIKYHLSFEFKRNDNVSVLYNIVYVLSHSINRSTLMQLLYRRFRRIFLFSDNHLLIISKLKNFKRKIGYLKGLLNIQKCIIFNLRCFISSMIKGLKKIKTYLTLPSLFFFHLFTYIFRL